MAVEQKHSAYIRVLCLASHCCCSLVSLLHRIVGCFPPLKVCMVLSGTVKASPQEGGFQEVQSVLSNGDVFPPLGDNQGQWQELVMFVESLEQPWPTP